MAPKNLIRILAAASLALLTAACAGAPRQDRDWYPYLARTAHVEMDEQRFAVRPVSDWRYAPEGPTAESYGEASYTFDQLRDVWFVLEPQPGSKLAAHTLLLFEFENDRLLGLTIEARREIGEEYSALRGIGRAFELSYVWASARDLLVRRAVMLDHQVLVYPLVLQDDRKRLLLRRVLERTAALEATPRYYNTLFSNCTNELAKAAGLDWNYAFILTGTADNHLFRQGVIPGATFEEAEARADLTGFVRDLNALPGGADFDAALLAELRRRARAGASHAIVTEGSPLSSNAEADPAHTIAIIGGGPAGLIAADMLSAAGRAVTLYEQMPSVGRKLLIAGRGGLNLTHSEPLPDFVACYGEASAWLAPMIEAFSPRDLIAWAEGLGQQTFVGSSGRVFPKAMKASPLLRALLARLAAQGVVIRTRWAWRGWRADGALVFATPEGEQYARAQATMLALGGASWPKLGATGEWTHLLAARGVEIAPLAPANCGFAIAWSDAFCERFAGAPLKNVALDFKGAAARGDLVITAHGIEGGAIYALSAPLRDRIAARGHAMLSIDLRPDVSSARLAAKLARPRGGDSMSNYLRKALNLSPLAINLLREAFGADLAATPDALAQQIKAAPLKLTATAPIARAISSAGGVTRASVDDRLMLRALPQTYVAGEMLDWEAPTGGYLLQASFATGAWTARTILTSI